MGMAAPLGAAVNLPTHNMSRTSKEKNVPSPDPKDGVSAPRVDDTIGFLLNDTARLTRRFLHDRLAKEGIRGGSWYPLRILWSGDGVTQRELAERLGMSQPSTLETLRAMEREGLIRFEREPLDKRKTRVFLTEQAWSLKAPLLLVAQEATRITTQGLSQPEQVALRMLLRIIRDTTVAALAQEPTDAAPEGAARGRARSKLNGAAETVEKPSAEPVGEDPRPGAKAAAAAGKRHKGR